MASPSLKTFKSVSMSTVTDAASWYCAIVLLALILLGSIRESSQADETVRGNKLLDRPCDEIYVVREGETLHTISDKCGDPYIVERNPHIHDPDDVFPGLVIKITPSKPRKLLR
ncbi:Peptidoglycan-binding LysM domain-containing family protein [Melia azedarach]|uniref:Peptidoglycan-binding LysM domain-containing family protein n=1 Tax=Melia azedarach TaxID=155640 RepID=A0ACC1X7F0_MELAZ|nr:Peptidoglycan-binding LysM domain-containing family protein [Melia azedarach]